MSATDAFRGLYALREAQREVGAIWNDVDLLMVPTAPGHPRHTEVDADPIGVNAELGRYTNFVNLLGWCALALPAGFTSHGLPFGVTFIAPAARDAALAALRHALAGERRRCRSARPMRGSTARAAGDGSAHRRRAVAVSTQVKRLDRVDYRSRRPRRPRVDIGALAGEPADAADRRRRRAPAAACR